MLSREDAILGELLVARGRLSRVDLVDVIARRAAGESLVVRLVAEGRLDQDESESLEREAAALDRLLAFDVPPDGRLDDFRLIREIGRGGMGVVFDAEQVSLGRRVAVKILPSGLALDERRARRFLREARVAARLRHPGLVPVFSCGRAGGVFYFAMERIDGGSLATRVAAGPGEARAAADLVAAVADAVAHLHENGVIHRDLKPSNVLMDSDGRPRVTDFGLVHDAAAADPTISAAIVGTPAYLPPEALSGGPPSPRADIYGLGALLYALLAGRAPYHADASGPAMLRLLTTAPDPLGDIRPDVPHALVALCERAMARDPALRHESASALARDLRGFLAGHEPSAPVGPKVRAPRVNSSGTAAAITTGIASRITSRIPGGFAAAAIALGLLAVAITWWAGVRGDPPWRVRESAAATAAAGSRAVPTLVARAPGAVEEIHEAADGTLLVSAFISDRFVLFRKKPSDLEWVLVDSNVRFFDVSPRDGTIALGQRREERSFPRGSMRWVDRGIGPVRIDPSFSLCSHWSMRWSPDGTKLALAKAVLDASDSAPGLVLLDVSSSRARMLASDGSHWLDWSPDGSRLALGTDRNARVFRLADGRRGPPLGPEIGAPLFVGPSRLAYIAQHDSGWGVFAADIDDDGAIVGTPGVLLTGLPGRGFHLGRGRDGSLLLHASASGASLFRARLARDTAAFEVAAEPLSNGALPFGSYGSVRIGPGGALWWIERSGEGVVHLGTIGPAGVDSTSLVAKGALPATMLATSAEGTRVAYAAADLHRGTVLVECDAQGHSTVLHDLGAVPRAGPVRAPDGTRLAWTGADGKLLLLGGTGGRDATSIDAPARFDVADWSPDGRVLAGTVDDGLALLEVPSGEGPSRGAVKRLGVPGASPRFLSDRVLLFTRGSQLLAVERDGSAERLLLDAAPARVLAFDLDPKTGVLVLVLHASGDEIWRLSGASAEP